MLKIGVLGVGHLGKIHLKCIQQAEAALNLVGFYDPDDKTAKEVAETACSRALSDCFWELID